MASRFIKQRCPKCGGNIYMESDRYGLYKHCMQCGYDYDAESAIKPAGRLVLPKLDSSSYMKYEKL